MYVLLCPVSVYRGPTSGGLDDETFRVFGIKGLQAGDMSLSALSINKCKRIPFSSESPECVAPAVILILGVHCHFNLY